MASEQCVRPEEKQTDRETTDQNNSKESLGESAPPQKQNEEKAPAAVETTNKTQKQTETPPYAYQHQPLEEQKASDYAPYPKFNEEESHQKQQQVQREERWGTPKTMGAPANPDAHPDNKEAAAGKLTDTKDPYVQDSAAENPKGTLSFEGVKEFSQRMEIVVAHLWNHLNSGSSVGDTALGRLNAGTRLLTHGGFEGVFRASFPSDQSEKLKKTYACFLSTSTGPVAGTIFISDKRLAFCSDRPLRYNPLATTPAETQGHAPPTKGENANGQHANGENAKGEHGTGEKEGGKAVYSYYKVVVPIEKIKEVVPTVNPNKSEEKYIEVITGDNFEFWFMGFVNYDKGVKNLQAAVSTPQQQQE